MNYLNRKQLPVIVQAEAAECGLVSLGMIAGYWGRRFDLPSLRRLFPISIQGATVRDLVNASKKMGLTSRPVKLDLGALPKLKLPAVLHWNLNHFVVLKRIARSYVEIHDPAHGMRRVSLEELSESFSGIALEFAPAPDFKKEEVKSSIGLRDLLAQASGLFGPLTQVVVFSILIQLIALLMPFYTQISIDQVVPTGDARLLLVLALGFGLIFVLEPIIELLRTRLIVFASTQVLIQLTSNLVKHMLSLPLPYFEKRSIGDLLVRLEASDQIRELLTEGFISAIVDLLLSVTTLLMMFYYSVELGTVVTITSCAVLLIRMMFVPVLKRHVAETLHRKGAEQSELIETLHGISSIKFAQKEIERSISWDRKFVDFAEASARLQISTSNFNFLRDLVSNIGMVLTVYLAVRAILELSSTFTVGALFAFISYRGIFLGRLESLMDQLIEFAMCRVHLERLSEIVIEQPEHEPAELLSRTTNNDGLLLDDVGFSYSSDTETVFTNLTATIRPGETVVITGPSGTGKTTLLKVLGGVYEASEGHIRSNGVDIKTAGTRFLRSSIAAVLQNDYLLKGSVIDNIVFFDDRPDFDRAVECAKLACVHEEISCFKMGYETLIGDMGTSLSQGQQQRVLLARALYQNKPILILDEGTAHLDEECEAKILKNLSGLGKTLVMTVHKLSLTDLGSQVWNVQRDGTVQIKSHQSPSL